MKNRKNFTLIILLIIIANLSMTLITEAQDAINPEIRDNSIVAGAKSLTVHANGSLVLKAGGQTVTFSPNFRTDNGWVTFFSNIAKEALKFDSDTNTFTTTANYPLDKTGKNFFIYKQQVILQSDGLVKVTCSWDVPKSWKGDFLQYGYYIKWTKVYEDRNIRIDGKDNIIKKGDSPLLSSTLKGQNSFEIFPNVPAESFVMKTLHLQKTTISSKGRLQIRMMNSKTKEYSFLLDFRESANKK